MKCFSSLFLFVLLITNVYASYSVDILDENDTLESVAKRHQSHVLFIYGNDLKSYMKDLKKWNPQVKDWNKPVKNQMIYIDYPYDSFVGGSQYAPKLGIYKPYSSNISIQLGYTFIFGKYSENTISQSVKTDIRNPGDFNINSQYIFENNHSLIGNIHWSLKNNSKVVNYNTQIEEKIKFPSEWGYQIKYEYIINPINSLSLLYEQEKINTINSSELDNGDSIRIIKNSIQFIGMGYTYSFKKSKLNLHLSKSIKSSNKDTHAFNGFKYLMDYTIAPENTLINYKIFYRHYNLKAQSKLKINSMV